MTKQTVTPGKETAARILAAAGSLISLHGFSRITMDDLGRELGMSKRTIYRYFSHKQELVETVFSNDLLRRKEALREARFFSGNAIEQLFLSWHVIHDVMYCFTTSFGAQLRNIYPHAHGIIKDFQLVFLRQYLKQNMETGITQGLYRNNIKPDLLSLYVTQVILSAEVTGAFADGRRGLVETDDQLFAYHSHAIATEKGARLIRKYKNEMLAHTVSQMGNYSTHSR